MNHLVIGRGEVGLALCKILGGCDIRDVEDPDWALSHYDVLHVAFPWQVEDFCGQVKRYQEMYTPTYTIVHSTVPVGTCDALEVVHSPVRGKHPDLYEGLKYFTKHYGGSVARLVAHELEPWFPQWIAHDEARITEAGKLWELSCFGMEVVMEKYIYNYCRRLDLPYEEVYHDFVSSYNAGWESLDEAHLAKPHLEHQDGPIGGHCVVQGAEMLNLHYRNLVSEVVIAVQAELNAQ